MDNAAVITDPGVDEGNVSYAMVIVLSVLAATVACFILLALAYACQVQKGQIAAATNDSSHRHGTYRYHGC